MAKYHLFDLGSKTFVSGVDPYDLSLDFLPLPGVVIYPNLGLISFYQSVSLGYGWPIWMYFYKITGFTSVLLAKVFSGCYVDTRDQIVYCNATSVFVLILQMVQLLL